MSATKICIKCEVEKLTEDFYLRAGSPDGLNNICKACCKEKARKWQDENPERKLELCRNRYHSNPEVKKRTYEDCVKYRAKNREKINARARARRAQNPFPNRKASKAWKERNADKVAEQMRARQLKTKYGITPAQFDGLVLKQSGKCAICDDKTSLAVDHCHATGKVRGLLCRRCNTALGLLRENPYIFERASEYVLAGGIL